MRKVILVLLATVLSFVCAATSHSDTLILRRADGTTYEMEGEIERYEDGKFVIMLDSGGKTSIPAEQVKVIKFEVSEKQKVTKSQRIEKPKQTVTSVKTETRKKTDGLKKTSSTTKPAAKQDTREIDLKAVIKVTQSQFIITNNDDFDWRNVKLEVNSRGLRSGYIFKTERMRAGQTYTVGAGQFTKSDGTRFNLYTTKAQKFFISCDTPKGKGYLYGSWK